MVNTYKLLLLLSVPLLFLGCGEESNYVVLDSSNTTTTAQTTTTQFSGVVVDGYIRDANICFDINMDSVCSSNEQTTTSDINGLYTLDMLEEDVEIVTFITTGGIDTSTGRELNDQLLSIHNYADIEENTLLVISPISDLVAHSFLNSSSHTLNDLVDANDVVSQLLGLSVTQLAQDPMLDINIFATSQKIQHTKLLLEEVVKKNLSGYTVESIQDEIKKQMIELNLNTSNILDTLEVRLNFSIPANEKTFVISQANELNETLNSLEQETSLDIDNLNRLQKAIDIIQHDVYTQIQNADADAVLDTIHLNITNETITQTAFDTLNAEYDENGCTSNNAYNILSTYDLINTFNEDISNRVGIKSGYQIGDTSEESEVTLYYPTISQSALFNPVDKIVVYEENYDILYDAAWSNSVEQTIYVKTPQDAQGLHSCYRYTLNSIHANEITSTKVFSYTELN